MKTITICLAIFFTTLGVQYLQAQQETVEQKIERLEQKKEVIIAEEKEALRKTVEKINRQLEEKKITFEEAEQLKETAAKKHALNIENRIAIVENEIAWLSRNGNVEDDEEEDHDHWEKRNRDRSRENRTSSSIVLAAGLNNAIEEGGSLNDLDFKIGGSRFFEIGLVWNTRVFNNTNWVRVKYGFSFQFNGLKPEDNQYFVEEGEMTVLKVYPVELEKSKFRMDNLVVPVHFEFGPSDSAETGWGTWYSTEDRFKIGLGGYAGLSLGERQKLKFEEDGDNVKKKMKNDFNTNDVVYGVSGYIGWGSTSLYVKYDLNPIFQEPNPPLYNVSAGLRFDLD